MTKMPTEVPTNEGVAYNFLIDMYAVYFRLNVSRTYVKLTGVVISTFSLPL